MKKDDNRIFIMNTLFNLAETFLIAALVDYFDGNKEYEQTKDGWRKLDNVITFAQVFQASRDGALIPGVHFDCQGREDGCG